MHCAALDENAHEDDEHDEQQHAEVPILYDILLERVQRLLVEKKIF